jgi:hypothetical protein
MRASIVGSGGRHGGGLCGLEDFDGVNDVGHDEVLALGNSDDAVDVQRGWT